jgi:hypothetical protein
MPCASTPWFNHRKYDKPRGDPVCQPWVMHPLPEISDLVRSCPTTDVALGATPSNVTMPGPGSRIVGRFGCNFRPPMRNFV